MCVFFGYKQMTIECRMSVRLLGNMCSLHLAAAADAAAAHCMLTERIHVLGAREIDGI